VFFFTQSIYIKNIFMKMSRKVKTIRPKEH